MKDAVDLRCNKTVKEQRGTKQEIGYFGCCVQQRWCTSPFNLLGPSRIKYLLVSKRGMFVYPSKSIFGILGGSFKYCS